jgi:hypothetical protein
MLKKLSVTALLLGCTLLSINLYGLFQTLRPANIELEHLRFEERDVLLSQDEFLASTKKMPQETARSYSNRLTKVIADGMAHIHWEKYPPEQFNQIVPIWENYILYLMGKLKITPEYERYHFSDPFKSIERGIGICGDAAMLMSQLLLKQNIPNKIVTIPGHVMVEAEFAQGKSLFDPDFGVVLPESADYYGKNPTHINTAYSDAGHYLYDDHFIINNFKKKHTYWNGIKHFITKKYYFEKFAYVMKWLFPLLLLIFGSVTLWKHRRKVTFPTL